MTRDDGVTREEMGSYLATVAEVTDYQAYAGTSAPIQETASKPGMPASATVGKLGSEAERWALVTAMGLSAPALICGITATMLSNMSWMRPLIRSV